MHELALAESLIGKIVKIAVEDEITAIFSVTLLIGDLSGVDKDALDFALPFASKGTLLETSNFIYEIVRLKVKCDDCNQESYPEVPIIACTHCHSDNIKIIAGREFIIKEMEVG